MRIFFALLKLFAFSIIVALISIVQPIILFFNKGAISYYAPQLWHKAATFIFGVRINVIGDISNNNQTIFMSNHVSYLDIPLLGSLVRGSFVAKEDVEGWALFGFLSTLQQTAFIKRKKTAIANAKNNLEIMLEEGKNLIIFPEGTSTDGKEVRLFKSSLFALPLSSNNPDLVIQPVTIDVQTNDGLPLATQNARDLYAWHVDMDMDLGPHLWRFAKTRGSQVNVHFHPPLHAADYDNRKILSKTCYEQVSSGLTEKLVA